MKRLYTVLLAAALCAASNVGIARAMEEKQSQEVLKAEFDKAIVTMNDEIKQIHLKLARSAIEGGFTENAKKYIYMYEIDINIPIVEMNAFNTGTTSTYLLQWAAYWENLDAVKFLIEKEAGVYHKDDNGSTALHEIAQSVSLNRDDQMDDAELEKQRDDAKPTVLAIAKLLIENGAKVSLKDDDGYTPLAFAVENGACNELKKLLLANGASVKELLIINEDS